MSCATVIRRMNQFTDAIDNPLIITGIFAIVSSATLLFIEVICRYLFSKTFPLFEELSVNLIIWGVMFFSGPVFKRGSHVGMEFIAEKLRGRVKILYSILINIVIVSLCYIFIWKGMELVQIAHMTGKTTNSGELEVWYMLLAMPVGGFVYGVYAVAEIIKLICVLIAPELYGQIFIAHAEEAKEDGII